MEESSKLLSLRRFMKTSRQNYHGLVATGVKR